MRDLFPWGEAVGMSQGPDETSHSKLGMVPDLRLIPGCSATYIYFYFHINTYLLYLYIYIKTYILYLKYI